MKRSTRTEPGTQTRERSLRPRSTSIVCSARSFSDVSSPVSSPPPGHTVPAIGFSSAREPLHLTTVSGELPDEREVAELEEEEVRRRVDAPQRAVELDRRGGCRPLGALRDDDLEDVALADVLLRPLDAADVLLARRLAHERPALAGAARDVRLRPFERARLSPQELGDAARVVEADENVGHEPAALGRVRPVGGERHGRLDPRDGVVAEVAERPAPRASPPPRRRRSATRRRRSCDARAVRARPTRGETRPRSFSRRRRYAPSGVRRSVAISVSDMKKAPRGAGSSGRAVAGTQRARRLPPRSVRQSHHAEAKSCGRRVCTPREGVKTC